MKTIIFETPRFDVVKEVVRYSDNSLVDFFYVQKPNAVLVIVEFGKKIGLLKVKRYNDDNETYELVGGRIEVGEEPFEAATRELLEEAGIVYDSLQYQYFTSPLPSVTSEKVYVFKACISHENYKVAMGHEGIIDFQFFSKDGIISLIKSGRVSSSVDGFALLNYLFLDNDNGN